MCGLGLPEPAKQRASRSLPNIQNAEDEIMPWRPQQGAFVCRQAASAYSALLAKPRTGVSCPRSLTGVPFVVMPCRPQQVASPSNSIRGCSLTWSSRLRARVCPKYRGPPGVRYIGYRQPSCGDDDILQRYGRFPHRHRDQCRPNRHCFRRARRGRLHLHGRLHDVHGVHVPRLWHRVRRTRTPRPMSHPASPSADAPSRDLSQARPPLPWSRPGTNRAPLRLPRVRKRRVRKRLCSRPTTRQTQAQVQQRPHRSRPTARRTQVQVQQRPGRSRPPARRTQPSRCSAPASCSSPPGPPSVAAAAARRRCPSPRRSPL
ncbi:hypothetical protein B0H15DRAFT_571422 [Mycena belliarum]|uniref:Uncharacterized protein n=1 Tax=Mycena belliarum TaxID=1033014 RepID=A0AAD6TWR9_9AGAR|nr:hypothetical protein B0H15DRAFT_571422 [Mycena belliae]